MSEQIKQAKRYTTKSYRLTDSKRPARKSTDKAREESFMGNYTAKWDDELAVLEDAQGNVISISYRGQVFSSPSQKRWRRE